MKFKRMLALLMSVCLALGVLSACGNSESSSTASTQVQGETKPADAQSVDLQTSGPAPANTGSEETESGTENGVSNDLYNVTWEDMAEINVVLPVLTTVPSGLADVEAAINAITESQINTHINLEMIEQGSYAQQVSLMIASGEQVDLMLTIIGNSTSFSTMSSQNQLQDITQLLEDYAPKALSAVGEVAESTRVDGKILGFPAFRNYYSGPYICMRTDVLEDLELLEKAQNMTSFTEFEEILAAVKNSEKWGGLTGIVPSGAGNVLPAMTNFCYKDKFADTKVIDNLGNTLSCTGVILEDENAQVIDVFSSEEYKENYELVKKWYDAGYVYKDSANTTEIGSDIIKAGNAFSYINAMGYGAEIAADSQCGMDMTCIFVAGKPVNTTEGVTFTYAVPMTAKEPEAAVTFIEMMFNDKEVLNLLTWGIEGKDYELTDTGVVSPMEQSGSSVVYLPSWMAISEFNVIPSAPWDLESWDKQRDYYAQAKISDYLGFSLNIDQFSNEVSALNTVINEYTKQIGSGVASETEFNDFLAKIKSSGIDIIVEAYQEALDAWIASR